jgi:hypothetical protein
MAARSHPRLRCNKNTHFNFTTNLNTDPKLTEEIGHIMDSVHRMSEKEVEKDREGIVRTSELNSFASDRVIRRCAWLAAILVLLFFPNAFAQTDFSAFWKKFRSAVITGDKARVAEMTKFPLSMPYLVKAVKNKEDFLRRYNEIFKGEASAAQCFGSAEPQKESDRRYAIYCPFKDTPDDKENAPIRFVFESTKGGWKFAGLDNINE